MKRFHPFFTIGTVGIILTSILHIFLAFGLSIATSHSIFFAIYSTFLAFMAIGMRLTIRKQKAAEQIDESFKKKFIINTPIKKHA